MKVVQFTIPVAKDNSIHVQEDILPHFYEHLHRHNEAQITWVISGEGTLIAGNYMQPFHSGDIFIIGANQPHIIKSNPEYFEKDSGKQVHSLNIFFDPKGFLTAMLDFPEMLGIKKFIDASKLGLQASEHNQKIISDYILKVNNNTAGYRLAAFIEMLQLLANLKGWKYLSTESFEYTTDSEGLRMDDIYQYTITNYTENITLEEIAAVVFLTPQSFCRYFKKHTLKTYTNFLNEVRINEACKKIMSHDFSSISTIAYQTGFNNVVTFNRVFRSITGKSPSEFIKEYNRKIEIVE
ncbi:MAG: AraC family transcriptional regulator [Ferruginibacter sp.]